MSSQRREVTEGQKQLEAGLQRRNEVAAKVETQARPPSAVRTAAADPIPVKEQL